MFDAAGERPEGLQAWMGLCEVVDRVRVLINRDLQAEVELTLAENLVLCQVAMAPGRRLRMVDISEGLGVAKSAVTKTVDRLEERGLLVRERDPGDRRSVHAVLSPAGHEVFATARPAFVEAVERHFAGQVDRATLRHLVELPALVAQPAIGQDRGPR
ncbi:MAG: MarR family winged helix-turn-helix transcriptional regulator [Acidimicrobiales bacterium]